MHARVVAATLLLLLFAACASKPTLRVSAERSSGTDFSSFQTYRWRTPLPATVPGHPRSGRDLLLWRMRNVVESQLAAKGYTQVESQGADLWVECYLNQRERHTDSINDFIEYRESGGQQGPQESYVWGYSEGTIIIEAYEAATDRLVWRGSATPIVNPEGQQEKVREAVLGIMQRFPAH